MTVNVNSSGSQSATINTEHTLATITTAGVYQLAVDLNNMASGSTPDILELRVYGKARSSDTERLIACSSFIGSQSGQVLFQDIARISPHYFKVTLKQTQGTGRAYPWAVYSI